MIKTSDFPSRKKKRKSKEQINFVWPNMTFGKVGRRQEINTRPVVQVMERSWKFIIHL